ncbi:MAG: type IV secretion system protein [Rickettsiales bacterium]
MHHARSTSNVWALLAAMLVYGFFANGAYAIGNDLVPGGFACVAGQSIGQLFSMSPDCPTELRTDNFFSFLICNMEQISSDLLGRMFCGMAANLEPSVWAAVTLAVVLFGVSFLIGLTPATGREAIMFLLKLGFVISFATEADTIIDYGYKGLIGGIQTGVSIVLTVMNGSNIYSGADLYAQLDKFVANAINYATDGQGKTGDDSCKNAIFALIATMMVVFPLMGYMALVIVARIAITVFRAVFGYVYAVTGIAFLMILSPFFLCFLLFKQTQQFFQKWLGYLTSFMLQAIILFAFLSFIVSLKLSDNNVLSNLTDVMMYKKEEATGTSFRWPWQYCTLCDFDFVDKTNGNVLPVDAPDNMTNAELRCKTPREAIRPTFATSPDSQGQLGRLLELAGLGLIPIIILAVIVERLLTIVPTISQRLAAGMQGSYAPTLGGGGGKNALEMPGESIVNNFGNNFKNAYLAPKQGDSVTRAALGMKGGLSGFRRDVAGTSTSEAAKQALTKKTTWQRYSADPNKLKR